MANTHRPTFVLHPAQVLSTSAGNHYTIRVKAFPIENLSIAERYSIITEAIVPRPIAWVGTSNSSGVTNLAPFSYFNAVSTDPTCLMFSIARKRKGLKKDTLKNIEELKVFSVSIPDRTFANQVTLTSAEIESDESEFDFAQVVPEYFGDFAAPSVKGAPIQMDCRLYQLLDIGDSKNPRPGMTTIVIGEIKTIRVRDDLLIDRLQSTRSPLSIPRIDPRKLNPLCRLGGDDYGEIGSISSIARPDRK